MAGRRGTKSDFCHVVTRWPKSIDMFHSQTAGLADEGRWQMTPGHAINFFRLDHQPEQRHATRCGNSKAVRRTARTQEWFERSGDANPLLKAL
jgi:hypothetical protein